MGVRCRVPGLTTSPIVTSPTTTPEETIAAVVSFFQPHAPLDAVGIGCFGPVDLRPGSPQWGSHHVDAEAGLGRRRRGRSDGRRHRRARGVRDRRRAPPPSARSGGGPDAGVRVFCYVTVGTGHRGAVDGRRRACGTGCGTPRWGTSASRTDLADDPYPGGCPFHGDCWEGLASGPAMAARWGRPGAELGADHPGWDLEAGYVAAGLANIALVLSVPTVRRGRRRRRAPGTGRAGSRRAWPSSWPATCRRRRWSRPALGPRAGILGALVLAERGPGVNRPSFSAANYSQSTPTLVRTRNAGLYEAG